MKTKKGDFGYINAKKKRSIIGVLSMLIIGIIVFLVGYFLNDMSNRNIFTVIAVLFALPGAKFMVGFIVAFPYKSVDRQRYDMVSEKLTDGMQLYTDLVITSSEKVMNLDFVAIGNGQVIGLIGKENQDIAYIREYLSTGVANWGSGYKVKIVDSMKIFTQEIESVKICDVNEEEEMNVKSYITSLIV